MKKASISFFLTLFLTSCVAHTPYTKSRIEIGHEEDKGTFIAIKLFDSTAVSNTINKAYNWAFGDDESE